MLSLKKQKSLTKENAMPRGVSASSREKQPFADVAPTPAAHFDLYFLAAAADLIRHLEGIFGTREAVFDEFPFLRHYDERLAGREPDDLADDEAGNWWEKNLLDWEENSRSHLPLRDLREKFELDFFALRLFFTIGLVEEDAGFAAAFGLLNDNAEQKRPTFGTIRNRKSSETDSSPVQYISQLNDAGLIQFGNCENPRSDWTLLVSTLLWDASRGENGFGLGDWVKFTPRADLLAPDELVLPEILREQIALLPPLIKTGEVQTVIVRGANHNGKKTILGALARALDSGLLEAKNPEIKSDERWKIFAALAVILRAMPVFSLDVAPGEMFEFPPIPAAVEAFGIALGKAGGVGGAATEKAVTITVKLPEETERQALWENFLGGDEASKTSEIGEIVKRFRLSSGNIKRAAALAESYSGLAKRKRITLADVRQATRALNRQALDTLAVYLEPLRADWSFLAVRAETTGDLAQLEERCRIRENLRNHVGAGLREQLQSGVRALFTGGSGTGKTYAARLLAAALEKDVYRLDLSTVVNKYIGETEKNLARVFALVEELDVILLLDEGDALLTQRTNVTGANDRYANLETNYLLQRLESFEGIIIVTTNASDRIDAAFERRMDAIVEFVAPEAAERGQIWALHLPENNRVAADFLNEIVERCELTGGQIRNVALHAASLALGEKKSLDARHIEAAVRREYRKMRRICPLRDRTESNFAADRW